MYKINIDLEIEEDKYFLIFEENNYFYYSLIYNNEILFVSQRFNDIEKLKNNLFSLQKNLNNCKITYINNRIGSSQFYVSSTFNEIYFVSFIYSTKSECDEVLNKIKEAYDNDNYIPFEKSLFDLNNLDEISFDVSFLDNKDENILIENNHFYVMNSKNKVIFESKEFSTEKILKNNILKIKTLCNEGNFTIFCDISQKYYFKLYDKYDRLCFIGLIFDSRSSCQNNIVELVKNV